MNAIATAVTFLLGAGALVYLGLSVNRFRAMVDFRQNIRRRCDDFLAQGRASGALDYPPSWLADERRPRGIVMCAGGPGLLVQAYTNLDVLRNHHACTLPVALYYVGEEEMPEPCRHFFESTFSDLRCIDATRIPDRPGQPPATDLRGFELKPFALLNAPFDELLFIDADSVPLRNPDSLFDMALYREHGNVFWPESCMLSTLVPHAGAFGDYSLADGRERRNLQGVNPRIFDYLRVPRPATLERAGYETESGQILLDRRRCFDAVQLTWFLCSRPRHLRLYFYGDTEAYRLAFGVAGRRFCQITHLSHQAGVVEGDVFLGKAMLQRDEVGVPAFLHQMHRKPSPNAPCPELTHVVEDLVVDHPRARGEGGVTLRAPVSQLSSIRPLDGDARRIDELVRKSHGELMGRLADAHLPPPRKPHWLNRRILPW